MSSNTMAKDSNLLVSQVKSDVVNNYGKVQSPVATVASYDSPKSIDNLPGNFSNEIKVFFSDIDGTLIPLDKSVPKGTIPPSVIEAKKELNKAGIPLILVTGRSSREGILISNKIGIQKQFVIAQQGAEIVDSTGKLIHEDGIPSSVVKSVIADVNSFNKKHKHNIVPFVYVKGNLYTFKPVELPYILDKAIVIPSLDKLGKDYISIKIGLFDNDVNTLRLLQKYLAKKYSKYNVVISADCYCDISSKTATKGNAIKLLARELGYELKNVAVIGDAENDISMLKLLKDNGGIAVAVDNANTLVKSNANYVSASVSNGGFLKAVKNVLKNNELLKLSSFSK